MTQNLASKKLGGMTRYKYLLLDKNKTSIFMIVKTSKL